MSRLVLRQAPDDAVLQAEAALEAAVAELAFLVPRVPEDLDAEALVVGVVPGEVAV